MRKYEIFFFANLSCFNPFARMLKKNRNGHQVDISGYCLIHPLLKSIVILPAMRDAHKSHKPRSRKVRSIYIYKNGRWYKKKSVNLPSESDPHRSRAPIRDRRSIDQVKQTTIMRRRINCSVLRAIY